MFYFLLDLFPQASCHCIRRGIVSTHFLSTILRVVSFSGFSYLAEQLFLPVEHVIVFGKYIIARIHLPQVTDWLILSNHFTLDVSY